MLDKNNPKEGPAFASLPQHVKENPLDPGHTELLLNALVQDGDAQIIQVDGQGPKYAITKQGLDKYPWLRG